MIPPNILGVPIILVVLAIYLLKPLKSRPRHLYPPGPTGLPGVGSLLDINAERPWITYSAWSKQYGK